MSNYKRILRRRDAPHVFYGWTELLAKRQDVLEEAWLDIDTRQQYDTLPEEPPVSTKPRKARRPRKKVAPKASRTPRAAFAPKPESKPVSTPAHSEADSLDAMLRDL
jgi:hypothetical protein